MEQLTLKEELGKALGRIASGVYVVTVDTDSGPHGMLATFVSQVAFEPPIVGIAVSAQRPILNDLEGRIVTVNILSKNNMDLFKAFARPAKGENDDRFAGLNLANNADGAIAFHDVVSYLNCEVRQLVPAGDHVVAFAEVVSGRMMNGEAEPMVHLRKNGFQY
jgi:flavin reductase (DIM6/NTAB) family NADH-FMN oxidoreductase RutF